MNFLKKSQFEGKYVFCGYVVDINDKDKKFDLITYFDDENNVFDAKLLSFKCNNDFDFKKIKEGDLAIIKATLENQLNPQVLRLYDYNSINLSNI